MPTVSVVIPCYNGHPHLDAAFESVLSQSFQDWELIYVDDCSTDASLTVARSFADRDARIKIHANPKNLGMVGNWNRACELAEGSYVKLLCADDVIYPNCLAEQVAVLERNPQACMVTGSSKVINSKGKTLLTRRPLRKFSGRVEHEVNASEALKSCIAAAANLFGEPSITLMRRSAMNMAGLFNSDFRYGTDLEYWLRLAAKSRSSIIVTGQTVAGFRLHPGSLTNQQMSRGVEELTRIFQAQVSQDPVSGPEFNERIFGEQYRAQTKAKGFVIAIAEKRWAIPLFWMLESARTLALR